MTFCLNSSAHIIRSCIVFQAYKSFVARHHLNDAKPVGLEDFSHDQLFFVAYAQVGKCHRATLHKVPPH